MLRFYSLTLVYIALHVLCFGSDVAMWQLISCIALINCVYIGIVVWGSAQIHSQLYLKTFCKNKKKQDCVALTFDDGPHETNTKELIALLDEFDARATFFLIGSKISEHSAIAKTLYLHGHALGNHSFSHSNKFPLKSSKTIAAEIEKTQVLLKKITGVRNVLFRPPFGVTNPMIARGLKGLGLLSIGWNIRSLDTVSESKEQTLDRVISRIKGGDIILFHDTTKDIVWIVREVLQYLKLNNMKAVTVNELMS